MLLKTIIATGTSTGAIGNCSVTGRVRVDVLRCEGVAVSSDFYFLLLQESQTAENVHKPNGPRPFCRAVNYKCIFAFRCLLL